MKEAPKKQGRKLNNQICAPEGEKGKFTSKKSVGLHASPKRSVSTRKYVFLAYNHVPYSAKEH